MLNLTFKNSAITSLSANINATTTSIPVVDANQLPNIIDDQIFYLLIGNDSSNYELVKVTGVNTSANTLTVQRAQENTSAKSFTSGVSVVARLTAGQLNDIIYQINQLEGKVDGSIVVAIPSAISFFYS